jgi:hypothetical protein
MLILTFGGLVPGLVGAKRCADTPLSLQAWSPHIWCRTHYTYESGREDITTLYLVPVAPGVTRAYNKVVLKNVASRTKSIFNFLSKTVLSSGFFHAFGHGLVDQVGLPAQNSGILS